MGSRLEVVVENRRERRLMKQEGWRSWLWSSFLPYATPIVIALVGGIFTLVYNSQQNRLREVELLSQFVEPLASTDPKRQQVALAAIAAMGNVQTAVRMGSLIGAKGESDPLGPLLLHAARAGDTELLTIVIEAGADRYVQDARKRSVFEVAAQFNRPRVIAELINRGWRPFGQDSPLFAAIHNNSVDALRELLKQPWARTVDANGQTPLQAAASTGNPLLVREILKHDREPDFLIFNSETGSTALHRAVDVANIDCVRLLLEHGANPNAQDKDGRTALSRATDRTLYIASMTDQGLRYGEIVRLLLSYKADPSIVNRYGRAPLHDSVEMGLIDCVRALTDGGADVNVRTTSDETPLSLAARFGRLEIAEYLIAHKAQLEGAGDESSPLVNAVHSLEVDLVRLLLKHRANFRWVSSRDGDSLLHVATDYHVLIRAGEATKKDQAETEARDTGPILQLLVDAGIDVNKANKHGRTALHFAVCHRTVEVVQRLKELGAKLDVQDSELVTPLMLAARYAKADTVEYLIRQGANPRLKDQKGRFAIDYLTDLNQPELLRWLEVSKDEVSK